jgi:membrane-bound lytic murein transglycosylase D
MFEDWHLSLAAYNRGEGAIAQLRSRTDDYWEMSDRGYLPRETRNYVPRFLATVEIARAAEEEGLEGIDLAASQPSKYDSLTLDRSITLRAVARLSGTSVEEITELNPAVCRGVVPAGYVLRVPLGSRESVEAGYASVEPATITTYEPRNVRHRVRRGETMGAIARRYGVSVKSLLRANGMRSPKSLKAGRFLRIPVKRKPAYRSYASNQRGAPTRQVN